jgi:RNA polymerase sigma factor (sigma-70 family)
MIASMTNALVSMAQAREEFLALVSDVRPELHRYCARLTGSVIEGEDIVQDTLAKALYAMSMAPSLPPLRPWLFRIAHNAALDFLKSHGRKHTETRADLDDVAGFVEQSDPSVVRAALATFLELPVSQRSAVILKDVLGHSLEETAATMATTVPAVKSALVRGRAALRASAAAENASDTYPRARLDEYAALFNAHDWDGVRKLVGEDCRLDLVSKSQRRGKAVGMYFGNYEKLDVRLAVVRLEGQHALAAFPNGATTPEYFILLEWDGERVTAIRDFRYVPYIALEADYDLVADVARAADA